MNINLYVWNCMHCKRNEASKRREEKGDTKSIHMGWKQTDKTLVNHWNLNSRNKNGIWRRTRRHKNRVGNSQNQNKAARPNAKWFIVKSIFEQYCSFSSFAVFVYVLVFSLVIFRFNYKLFSTWAQRPLSYIPCMQICVYILYGSAKAQQRNNTCLTYWILGKST